MRLLLDAHALIWWLADSPELSPEARGQIASAANEVAVSAASAWEMSIKQQAGKLRIPAGLVEAMAASGLKELPIAVEHGLKAGELPPHHADPFDRMLIAQALIDGFTIVTRDPHFQAYGVPILAT